MIRRAGVLAGLLSLASCAASAAGGQAGGGPWRSDERVLITDFSSVHALARGFERVFAATGGGLVIYDEIAGRFELPLTREDGYPSAAVSAMTHDDRDGTVWLATIDGRLVQVDPTARRFVDDLSVGARVLELVPAGAESADLFVRTPGGWLRLDPFTRRTAPVAPETVAEAREHRSGWRERQALLADPGFRSLAGLIGSGYGRTAVRVTDVVPARGADRFWVATDGAFLWSYDHLARAWSPLAFGILGQGVAAIAREGDRIWFAPWRARRGRFGIARADTALRTWLQWNADSARSVPGPELRALARIGGALWAAGSGGLYRLDLESGEWRAVMSGGGLPAYEATALAPGPDGAIWLGTDRGAHLLSPAGTPAAEAGPPGERVEALLSRGDTVWIGTRRGLFVAGATAAGGGEAAAAIPAGGGPLRRPALALAAAGDTLYAGLGTEVWRRRPGAGWRRVDAIGPVGGEVTALAVGGGVVWVGSAAGIVRWDARAGEVARYTFAAGDLPSGPGGTRVFDLAPAGDGRVWAATPAGAIRLEPRF